MRVSIEILLKGKGAEAFTPDELEKKALYHSRRKKFSASVPLYEAAAARSPDAHRAARLAGLAALDLCKLDPTQAMAAVCAAIDQPWRADDLDVLERLFLYKIAQATDATAFAQRFEEAIAACVPLGSDFPESGPVQDELLAFVNHLAAVGEAPSQGSGVASMAASSGARSARGAGRPALTCTGAGFPRTPPGAATFQARLLAMRPRTKPYGAKSKALVNTAKTALHRTAPERRVVFVVGQPICSAFWSLIRQSERSKTALARRLWRLPPEDLIAFAASAFEAGDLVRSAQDGPLVSGIPSHLSEDSTQDLTDFIVGCGQQTWEAALGASDADLELLFYRQDTERWVHLTGLAYDIYTAHYPHQYGPDYFDRLQFTLGRDSYNVRPILHDPLEFWPVTGACRGDPKALVAALQTAPRLYRWYGKHGLLVHNLIDWHHQTELDNDVLRGLARWVVSQGRAFYCGVASDPLWWQGAHPLMADPPADPGLCKAVTEAHDLLDDRPLEPFWTWGQF